MFRIFHRKERAAGDESGRHRPPPPGSPLEIGLALRSARERAHLSLEDIRARTDVPVVDLDALERGQLELFHVEQAAIIGLWRYAEAVEVQPDPLVEVVRRFWPNPSLGVEALAAPRGIASTPISQLSAAQALLGPIVKPRQLAVSKTRLGLSPAMHSVLAAAALGASQAIAEIGPARPKAVARPKSQKAIGAKGSGSSSKKNVTRSKATAALPKKAIAKTKSTPASTERLALPVSARAISTPLTSAVLEPDVVDEGVPAPQSSTAPAVSEVQDGARTNPPTRPAGPLGIQGRWGARLVKVVAERLGAEETGTSS